MGGVGAWGGGKKSPSGSRTMGHFPPWRVERVLFRAEAIQPRPLRRRPPPLSCDEVGSQGTNSGSRRSISVTVALGVPPPRSSHTPQRRALTRPACPATTSLSPACSAHFGTDDECLISVAAPPPPPHTHPPPLRPALQLPRTTRCGQMYARSRAKQARTYMLIMSARALVPPPAPPPPPQPLPRSLCL